MKKQLLNIECGFFLVLLLTIGLLAWMVQIIVEDMHNTKRHLLTCTACVITDSCLAYDALIIKEGLNKDVKAIVPEGLSNEDYNLQNLQLNDSRIFQQQSK
jgi:hypothetical protein